MSGHRQLRRLHARTGGCGAVRHRGHAGQPAAAGAPRSVASYDEDTTSMGVEAGRIALRNAPEGARPAIVAFSTTAPAYVDKTNATAIHAALGLRSQSIAAFDVGGSVRSGVAAMWLAQAVGGLAVLSDIRTGQPGGADEANGGDAAVAFLLRRGRCRVPSRSAAPAPPASSSTAGACRASRLSKQWEERFGEHAYLPLVEQAITDALKGAGVSAADLDHVVVAGLPPAGGEGRRPRPSAPRPRPMPTTSRRRSATPASPRRALMLADVLDRAEPDQVDPGRAAGRRVRRLAPAHHRRRRRRRPAARSPCTSRSRRPGRPHLRLVPDLARLPAPRAAPPPRARPAGRRRRRCAATTGSTASYGTRTRPASSTCRRLGCRMEQRRHRPDDPDADGRRAGHDRHVHRRPARLLAVARRSWPPSSTSTVAAASSASSPTSTPAPSRSATGSR